jgi:hypothetical protein
MMAAALRLDETETAWGLGRPMRFAPLPENDFRDYIHTYYRECRARFDRIEAIAGKWMYRDLFPAMSDFDTRFIVRDGLTAADWCAMSTASRSDKSMSAVRTIFLFSTSRALRDIWLHFVSLFLL